MQVLRHILILCSPIISYYREKDRGKDCRIQYCTISGLPLKTVKRFCKQKLPSFYIRHLQHQETMYCASLKNNTPCSLFLFKKQSFSLSHTHTYCSCLASQDLKRISLALNAQTRYFIRINLIALQRTGKGEQWLQHIQSLRQGPQ